MTQSVDWDDIARKLQSLYDRNKPGGIAGVTGDSLRQQAQPQTAPPPQATTTTIIPPTIPEGYLPVRAWGEGAGLEVGWTGQAPTLGGQPLSNFINIDGRTYAPRDVLEQYRPKPPQPLQPLQPLQQVQVAAPVDINDYLSRERFQSPETLTEYINAIIESQQPMIDTMLDNAMKRAAVAGANRGIWNSGIQAELENQLMSEIMSGIQARAIQDALQYGALALQERRQTVDQYLADLERAEKARQFDLSHALSEAEARGYIDGSPTAYMMGVLSDALYKKGSLENAAASLDHYRARDEGELAYKYAALDQSRARDEGELAYKYAALAQAAREAAADRALQETLHRLGIEASTDKDVIDDIVLQLIKEYREKLASVESTKDAVKMYEQIMAEIDADVRAKLYDEEVAERIRQGIMHLAPPSKQPAKFSVEDVLKYMNPLDKDERERRLKYFYDSIEREFG